MIRIELGDMIMANAIERPSRAQHGPVEHEDVRLVPRHRDLDSEAQRAVEGRKHGHQEA